ncbi:septum site-determining protein MinC [Marinomonas mediterranea]|jgi:septum site-determining protein MinC|uniref:Probable septum site-determining protein MinC n=1 Tax=Marinomonas mediterranea (strain ATCC 700492 / JCM 21426 / NBRC 103028 / MMB-1) TaxID=717774 RepID=F2JU53_MARM1|nr:septum site-determining protein MinC [Marinomonas mediterranea]ADZ91565.1 septum site-determining protein minC [Marinomonas mediterranea MMB-1]WCN09527.1 septum site-determining protein MinC [Marinomonas mediterranea]WCN13603.1 septum site-determining protein MinC [Marinomonas mediterranea]WCN17669.1 septum site-determining protein MinC [Marinomonas mediterranea MMB-1]
MSDISFRLKGSVVTTVLLEIHEPELDRIRKDLAQKIEQVPHFFNQAPVIVDLAKCRAVSLDEFEMMVKLIRDLGMSVIGWRSKDNLPDWLDASSIPQLPDSKSRDIKVAPVKEVVSDVSASSNDASVNEASVVIKKVIEEKHINQPAKVITKPIRSGQQVYAEGDLIVLSQVSAGAEVLADGNIHVYGALRGRALAGVRGDEQARIFCKSLEAELVSIAGNFMLSDSLQKNVWKESAQVALVDDNLEVAPL